MELFYILGPFLAFISGWVLGLSQKGIHIHVHKEQPKKQEGYNPSMVKHLDPEVKQYYNQTHGLNQWK